MRRSRRRQDENDTESLAAGAAGVGLGALVVPVGALLLSPRLGSALTQELNWLSDPAYGVTIALLCSALATAGFVAFWATLVMTVRLLASLFRQGAYRSSK